ncbi:Protein NSG2 [Lachnellula arida]|uniref:Protein NSG2 n=1 Tax=Lachnellula arida TaxID=1316785 RepID=A0A8T9BA52_9HELO|nr:Protein NSG2 [Lachnellula arida]
MSSSPKLYRPTPHRPFDRSSIIEQPPSPLLSPALADEAPSRTGSILNLTSSTLLGIYSPTGYTSSEYGEPSTPWGTGAQTPLNGPSLPPIRRKSTAPPPPPPSTFFRVFSLALRSILLFGMGMGYGLLVRHLHDDQQLAPFQVGGLIEPSNDWRYLVFWGVAGVALGSLLPWVDTLFLAGSKEPVEEYGDKKISSPNQIVKPGEDLDSNSILDADWTPVVRSVGGFVGIAFAIRKLPWSSTLQASLTLAFVNPVLWYLIDRSKPGLLLSTAVGVTGTLLHFVVTPEIMPSPVLSTNSTTENHEMLADLNVMGMDLGGYINRENIEGAIWVLSVLFCSCVCFGNIGRRLALSGFGMRKDVGRNLEKSTRR